MNYLRLKKQSDFNKLFSGGKRAFSPSFTMIYAPAKQMRMGISVGKRHGKSVKRNRIKRLLREAFRSVREESQGNYSIVLVPKVKDDYSFFTFRKHLQWIIAREKL